MRADHCDCFKKGPRPRSSLPPLPAAGDVLLASAFISYIGPFTKKYRDELVNKHWVPFLETAAGGQRIPMAAKPNPMSMLTDEATIAVWSSQGLPDDKVSIENGSIVSATQRWPLLIDPQLQGITWVREKEKANGLIIVRLDQKDMLRKLEMAIERGTPVLVENMGERIDAVLSPVIARQLIKKGFRQYLSACGGRGWGGCVSVPATYPACSPTELGDKEVEFNPKFKLYLHTKCGGDTGGRSDLAAGYSCFSLPHTRAGSPTRTTRPRSRRRPRSSTSPSRRPASRSSCWR